MNDRYDTLSGLCTKYGVDILYSFGSRAGELKAWLEGEVVAISPSPSDIDIAARLTPGVELTVEDKVRLALNLEDLFHVSRVDLVCFNDADPFLAANMVRGERLYARDQHRADEFDLYILRRAGDLAPLERERMALVLRVSS